jgi:hypothetical protein
MKKAAPILHAFVGICIGVLLLKGVQGVKQYQTEAQLNAQLTNAHLVSLRQEVPLQTAQSNRLMVALTFGQAHSANAGETPKKASGKVFNFYNGKIYQAQDPLLGATGDGGSVWTRLGDQLLERKLFDSVIFVPIGVGGSTIARWQPGGDLHEKLIQSIRSVTNSGLTITHLLWHQGESDTQRQTSKEQYQNMFRAMLASIRREDVTAPIYVAVSAAARCKKHHPNPAIREAQQQLVDSINGIFPGPDTDPLDISYRYDGCHFTDEGLEKVSGLWLEILTETKVVLQR